MTTVSHHGIFGMDDVQRNFQKLVGRVIEGKQKLTREHVTILKV
jgi:hypothetical protein